MAQDRLIPSTTLIRIVAGLLIVRALYAVLLAFTGWSVWLETGWIETATSFEAIIQTANPPRMVLWAVYATGYLIAGYLLLTRNRYTLPVFAAAFTIDLMLWALSAANPLYDQIFLGWATQIDSLFNVIDFVFLIVIGWFHYRGIFIRPA